MLMLVMCLCFSNRYEVISNCEVGKGRSDIILKAKDERKTSFIIEFKYLKESKKDIQQELDQLAEQAVEQIKTKHYDQQLKGKVVYVGLAHQVKDVAMKWN